jgi:RNA polymerase sigma-70 factor (ECF subfamily)
MPLLPAVNEAEPPGASIGDRAAGDAANVRAARSGDRAAFARLYERFGPVVHAALLARVRCPEAEDLTQEVFIAAWRGLDSLREDGAFGGWELAMARNAAADWGARESRRRAAGAPTTAEPAVGGTGDAGDRAEAVLGLVRGLPEAYRETLLMRLVAGLSGPEIAARTGMSHGSVRVNLHRGMAMVRAKLEAMTRAGEWP